MKNINHKPLIKVKQVLKDKTGVGSTTNNIGPTTPMKDKESLKDDIIAERQLEKDRQSIILRSIAEGVITTYLDGSIMFMNPVAEKLTGWKSEEAENKPFTEVFHIVDAITRESTDNPIETVLKTGKPLKLDTDTILISRNETKEYAINDSCAPILDTKGNIMGVVLVFSDVTKQKKQEALKEKIIADLEQRNKDHEHFSSIISHDLKSPVSNIISLMELVNDDDLKEGEREFIMNALTASAEQLNEVIVDLNIILNVGNKLSEKRKKVHFSKLVSDIQTSIGHILESEHVRFNIDFSAVDYIYTIKSYMYSIFYNLISNSVKYKRPNVPIKITVHSKLVDGNIVLTFRDNGLGFDLKSIGDNMFGMHQRFHADKAEGKGMGLYMVKLQVEKIGGNISVQSKVNKGTEFKIVLPPQTTFRKQQHSIETTVAI